MNMEVEVEVEVEGSPMSFTTVLIFVKERDYRYLGSCIICFFRRRYQMDFHSLMPFIILDNIVAI